MGVGNRDQDRILNKSICLRRVGSTFRIEHIMESVRYLQHNEEFSGRLYPPIYILICIRGTLPLQM